MNKITKNKITKPQLTPEGRLLSLDFFRGITMFLLIGGFTGLFSNLVDPSLKGTFLYFLGTQFQHYAWNGLRFWDLVMPFFMFIVGVAMPFSFAKRTDRGDSYKQLLRHAIQRSLLLLVFGWALYCIGQGRITFRFQNILAQLSVAYIIAFLLIKRPVSIQLFVSFLLLGITELLYRAFPVEGFNHPFVPNENFGTWFDLLYNGADLNGHWVSFNAVPTTAHTIWGVLAGKLLLSTRPSTQKIKILVITGLIGLIAGYALDPLTPIIKRITTSSFVIVSGGWSLIVLAFSFWLIDVRKYRKWAVFFAIVGMNPLLIYLFSHVGGVTLVRKIIEPFSMALFRWSGELSAEIITNTIVWFLLWYLCYWLYKKKIFIKI